MMPRLRTPAPPLLPAPRRLQRGIHPEHPYVEGMCRDYGRLGVCGDLPVLGPGGIVERAEVGAGPASEHVSNTRRGTGHRQRRRFSGRVVTLALLACAATFLGLFATPAAGAAPRRPADNTYDLPEPRVFLEGIGVDRRAGWIYVSATNRMGTIYRGRVGSGQL